MFKSFSVTSFSSDQLNDAAEEEFEFEVAPPYDKLGEHASVGKIVVAKAGDCLPLTTKYKKTDPGNTSREPAEKHGHNDLLLHATVTKTCHVRADGIVSIRDRFFYMFY